MPGIILNIRFTYIRVSHYRHNMIRDSKITGLYNLSHQAHHPHISFLLVYWDAGRRPGSWTCPLLWLCWEHLTYFHHPCSIFPSDSLPQSIAPTRNSRQWSFTSLLHYELFCKLFFFSFIFVRWRLITSKHFSGFCHTLK